MYNPIPLNPPSPYKGEGGKRLLKRGFAPLKLPLIRGLYLLAVIV
jgi:hypothetical protein